LFSAAVAALISVSIQDLKPNPQDTSNFYLANIYTHLAGSSASPASIPSSNLAEPPPFSPPGYAIWVNSLFLLSLSISLTCALLATLLQQWVRRYIRVTQPPRCNPHKRARIRAFFANGIDKFHLPWVVEVLPTLLHLSLFLFFSGLLIYFFNINRTVFSVVVWWVGLSGSIYACITFLPIFQYDSPFYAPPSLSVWSLYNGMSYAVLKIIRLPERCFVSLFGIRRYLRICGFGDTYHNRLVWGIEKIAQEAASNLSGEIDGHILKWTIDTLNEDHELEQFFEGSLRFVSSNVSRKLVYSLRKLDGPSLNDVVSGFLNRTWSSSLVSETVKYRRLANCLKFADTGFLSYALTGIISSAFGEHMNGILQSVQMGNFLRGQSVGYDGPGWFLPLCVQGILAGIIAGVSERDEHWVALAMNQLGLSEDVIRQYMAHGDSILLANLIHITRHFLLHYLMGARRMVDTALLDIIPAVSGFDIHNTLPELQNNFCALWNEIILKLRNLELHWHAPVFLQSLRHFYIALHPSTDADPGGFYGFTDLQDLCRLSPYPLCNIPGHRLDSTTHDEVVSATGETGSHPPRSPNSSSSMVPPPNTGLALTSPPTMSDISYVAGLNPDSTDQQAEIESSDEPQCSSSSQPVPECIESSDHSPPTSIGSDIADTSQPIVDASAILPTTHPGSSSTSNDGMAPQREGTVIGPSNSSLVLSGRIVSSPSPVLAPGPGISNTSPGDSQSPLDPYIPHEPTTISSAPPTAHSPATLRVTSVSNPNHTVTTSMATPNVHDDTEDMNVPIQVEIPCDSDLRQFETSPSDLIPTALQPQPEGEDSSGIPV
jgi:Family of unknown function (DUF6535)